MLKYIINGCRYKTEPEAISGKICESKSRKQINDNMAELIKSPSVWKGFLKFYLTTTKLLVIIFIPELKEQ
jgi:hypothetical protein